MAINIVDVEEVLSQQPHPLTLMSLEALNPAREPYRAILLQPSGVVEANDVRVGHADATVGHALCSGFLSNAAESHSDLAVAPEYCVPWSVVDEIVAGNYRPPQGAVWVLGCESISPVDFQSLGQRYNASGKCVFHHELLDARQAAQRRYLDPLLYVFWAQNRDGQPVLFLLVQLKTVACRDYRDVEQTSLCLGKTVYAFNRGVNSMSLISIICSDAFDFSAHIDQVHTNCLLIHIQLNPKPAHADYAAYRTRLCSVGTNSHVELLCLNWAKNIKEVKKGGSYADWNNVAGSAWYAPPIKFSGDDGIIDSLHRNGLYYSLLAQRWHSFFLNYQGQIIQLQKQKLLFLGEQALAPKNFIAVEERWSWIEATSSWQRGAVADDGFSGALAGYQAIAGHLLQASLESPLAVERVIEILMGPRGTPASWYTVKELDAVHLDRDEESMRRVTVHQDTDLGRPGSSYRLKRLQRAHDAIELAHSDVPWPPSVRDLANGFKFSWRRASPHHNVETNDGMRGTAALVYLSDQANDLAIEAAYQKLITAITNQAVNEACAAGKDAEEISDAIVRAQDRLCVVFRRNNRFRARGPQGMNLIDVPSSASPVDFSEERS
ncbi:hypothetical protein [Pseudomonas viridiflava]|uniref:hypothetical protein n=1 Tax=Pseudomonas viridiflava TaxID=33069 RepID=UPI001F07DEFE|nr:hypothetical protein [Pseudomonas viridiflava]